MNIILKTQKLAKEYRMGDVRVDALRNVDFAVKEGEFVAIMGPSGSGKSTLMHLMGGLDRPTSGEIWLNGRSLHQMDDDTLTLTRRREIGFVFQFFNLMPTLTAGENVALPLMMDGKAQQLNGRVHELLDLVGLGDRIHHKPHQLSGGQQQRVAIARALVNNPKIVLADEPTGNLDSQASGMILEMLRNACDEQGQTIVIVTHDKRAAAAADHVVFLKDGEIVHDLNFEKSLDRTRTQEISAISNVLEM